MSSRSSAVRPRTRYPLCSTCCWKPSYAWKRIYCTALPIGRSSSPTGCTAHLVDTTIRRGLYPRMDNGYPGTLSTEHACVRTSVPSARYPSPPRPSANKTKTFPYPGTLSTEHACLRTSVPSARYPSPPRPDANKIKTIPDSRATTPPHAVSCQPS